MVRQSTVYVCQNCGEQYPKWAGKCPNCGQWNSLVETIVSTKIRSTKHEIRNISSAKPLKISEVESKPFARFSSQIGELDRVLGDGPPAGEAGIVPGSVVLVAGSPGMGKSTLLTQLALKVADTDLLRSSNENFLSSNRARKGVSKKIINSGRDAVNAKTEKFSSTPRKSPIVIYVCGEESPSQVKLRVDRLLGHQPLPENLLLLPETNTESVIEALSNIAIKSEITKLQDYKVTKGQGYQSLVIIDSIQTMWTEKLTGVAGSVGQIRESAQMLLQFAKENNVTIFLVGHVTKEGAIAGPKILEHLVDVVLYLEGDGKHEFRLLRSVKNRFGSTDEVGVFLMHDSGMEEVNNPSEIFLPEQSQVKPGSSVVVAMQGTRPVLVEIQALVTTTSLAMPRRIATGIDQRRLQVLCAILQKHAGFKLSDKDVYVNVAGGLTLKEPAADLGICLAIASSYKNKPLNAKAVAIGEVGLLGELRRVSFMERRIKEAQIQGYKTIFDRQTAGEIRALILKAL
ncbi:hypothetical protein A2160_04090 [Candidatus Beckwithbacteria bacterium RBG_13_42_9]|uniref:DNA repair protein RadA n=1 Tax=Candidatus Beckwithbacteria bacterium RBG_13_42_9 TaxID=1797457 RepID=A0A1F5E6B8_9BACT|nr:MAG: hypothetical protein A2160_04090 [Candidatus Beckwithbacteria bacterium RBG_13_42_9]